MFNPNDEFQLVWYIRDDFSVVEVKAYPRQDDMWWVPCQGVSVHGRNLYMSKTGAIAQAEIQIDKKIVDLLEKKSKFSGNHERLAI